MAIKKFLCGLLAFTMVMPFAVACGGGTTSSSESEVESEVESEEETSEEETSEEETSEEETSEEETSEEETSTPEIEPEVDFTGQKLAIRTINKGLGVDWLNTSVKAFNKKYGTEVTVEVEADLQERINSLLTTSKNEDVYFTFSSEIQWVQWYQRGAIYDLADIQDSIVYRDTEYAKLGIYEDKRVIMPYAYPPTGFVYNQEILDQVESYGDYKQGEFPTTWQGLLDLCETISTSYWEDFLPFSYGATTGDMDYILKGLWAQIDPVGFKAYWNQEEKANIDNNENKNLFVNDGMKTAMKKIVELLNPIQVKGKYVPCNTFSEFSSHDNMAAQELFINGNCAFTISGAWFETEMKTLIEQNKADFYHFAPAPKVSEDNKSTVFINSPSEYFLIAKNGKNNNPELAKFFLQFMAQEKQAQTFQQKTGTPCAMKYTTPKKGLTTFQKEIDNVVKNSVGAIGASDQVPSLAGLLKFDFKDTFTKLATSAPSDKLIASELESWYNNTQKRNWKDAISKFHS